MPTLTRSTLSNRHQRILALLLALSTLSGCEKEEFPTLKVPPIDLNSVSSPTAADFSSESQLSLKWDSTIWPYYQAGIGGYLTGVGGKKVFYKKFIVLNEKAAIVILPGRTEPAAKFAEVIYDLTQQNFSVYVMSHRGQGESDHLVSSNLQIGHVESYSDFLADLNQFVNSIVIPSNHAKTFALAHSMGGAIAMYHASKSGDEFDGYALSAPMLEINANLFQAFNSACTLSQTAYAPTQHDFDTTLQFTDADNDVTQSLARFNFKKKLFTDNPSWQLGGPSNRWLCQSQLTDNHLKSLNVIQNIQKPILMLTAGNDKIVQASVETEFCKNAPRCQQEIYSDSYHEILMERDPIRNDAMMKAVRFFNILVKE